MAERDITHALSFDIEDWFHMVEIEAVNDPTTWDALPSIDERETEWILETLRERKVRATFIELGWIADRYPELDKSNSEERGECKKIC